MTKRRHTLFTGTAARTPGGGGPGRARRNARELHQELRLALERDPAYHDAPPPPTPFRPCCRRRDGDGT